MIMENITSLCANLPQQVLVSPIVLWQKQHPSCASESYEHVHTSAGHHQSAAVVLGGCVVSPSTRFEGTYWWQCQWPSTKLTYTCKDIHNSYISSLNPNIDHKCALVVDLLIKLLYPSGTLKRKYTVYYWLLQEQYMLMSDTYELLWLQSTQQTHPTPTNWSTGSFYFDLDSSDSGRDSDM